MRSSCLEAQHYNGEQMALDSWKDLQEGAVYLFNDERYKYELVTGLGQYERLMGTRERHAFTRWPEADLSRNELPASIFLADDQVDELIARRELIEE